MIPKIIHQIWIGSKSNIPDCFKRATDHLLSLHPDYEYILWSNDNFPSDFINQDIIDDALEHKKRNSVAVACDAIRYEILAQYGGLYVDLDYVFFKNLTPLIEGKYEILSQENETTANNCFIGCSQNHPFMHHLINNMRKSYFGMKDVDTLLKAGGVFYYADQVSSWRDHLNILPHYYVSPFFPYTPWREFESTVLSEPPPLHMHGVHLFASIAGDDEMNRRINCLLNYANRYFQNE